MCISIASCVGKRREQDVHRYCTAVVVPEAEPVESPNPDNTGVIVADTGSTAVVTEEVVMVAGLVLGGERRSCLMATLPLLLLSLDDTVRTVGELATDCGTAAAAACTAGDCTAGTAEAGRSCTTLRTPPSS